MSPARHAPRGNSGGPRRGGGFTTRLLLAQVLVLVAGALTTWLVASVVGPGIFHDHLVQAGAAHSAAETRHIEEAFISALLISLGVALLMALIAALGVSWYLSRRVQLSLGQVTDAAAQIAAGGYAVRVSSPGLGTEFATLADTYNALAEKLGSTDATRRRMLADLAHEMRTPLTTIDAHLEAVEDGVRDLDGETLTVLRDSTRRLRRLSDDIGAVSHAEEGDLDLQPRPVDAAALAAAAVASVADRYTDNEVELHSDIRSAGWLTADPERIAQVLGNLLDNALRHTPSGGRVVLSCRRNDGWVEYVVADSGDGIASEHLRHVFDRFYRIDTARDRGHGGSGIGLAIARALTEAHRGRISATSPGPGQGATFTLRLPGLDPA